MNKILFFVALFTFSACSHTKSTETTKTNLPAPIIGVPAEKPVPAANSFVPLSEIRGEVMKRSRNLGFPLSGQTLELVSEDGTSISSTQSNSDGSFRFKGDFTNGRYMIRLISDRFKAPELSFSRESYPPKGLKVFAEAK